jgi:hypothetical protein
VVVARQQQGRHVPAATNTHATVELLDAVFSMRSLYQILCVVKESKRESECVCVCVCVCGGQGQLLLVRSSQPQQRGIYR